eukprot:TRINITY_DN17711_c0_g1_i1.p1 TRINITY_DN17711_c0_g1~~TRINITY_DN17711_c0_g1_i1.p1  ORF type:complete len:190 (-),score=46.72 TRINITY_DN17711_c0_g1_i1:158-727(-)
MAGVAAPNLAEIIMSAGSPLAPTLPVAPPSAEKELGEQNLEEKNMTSGGISQAADDRWRAIMARREDNSRRHGTVRSLDDVAPAPSSMLISGLGLDAGQSSMRFQRPLATERSDEAPRGLVPASVAVSSPAWQELMGYRVLITREELDHLLQRAQDSESECDSLSDLSTEAISEASDIEFDDMATSTSC